MFVEQLEKLRQVNAQGCAQKAERLLLELAGKEVALDKYADYPHIRRNIVAEKRTIAIKAAAMISKWYEELGLYGMARPLPVWFQIKKLILLVLMCLYP